MGLTALCSAIVGSFAPSNVIMNPFDWGRFLSGRQLHEAKTARQHLMKILLSMLDMAS